MGGGKWITMNKIVIDFETYSPVPIDAGSYKYASHPDADIVILAYKINDLPTLLWTPSNGRDCPLVFEEDDLVVYAHNALFDYLIWHKVGVRKYGFPELPLPHWTDTMALAQRYTLPAALDKVGDVLGLDVQKSRRGKNLIKKICVPHKHGGRPILGTHFDMQDMLQFQKYAIDDVESTYELIRTLPATALSIPEQRYWELTQKMNMRGLPVDVEAVDKILGYIEGFAEDMTLRVSEITDGQVDKVTQVAKMVAWLASQGVETKDLRAETVTKLLQQEIPVGARELLELRQTLGRSSTAKYRKIMEMQHDGRVYNNLQYYGTSTGRWAGRGFQLHNLPRASVRDPLDYIERFINFEPVADPVNVAKALIRPMIRAEDGYQLIVSDYSAIENRLLAWVAKDEQALALFRQGGDQYVDMASFMYGKAPQDISKHERQIGKIIILGCGYGMGAKRFVETAAGWGVDLSHSEALAAVNAYRTRYHLVKNLWYKLKDQAVNAINYPGREFMYNGCSFRMAKDKNGTKWLVLRLPSERQLYYCEPYLEEDDFGMTPGHYGINPYSKKWSRLRLIPGRITENVIQALARDVMAQGLLNVDHYMNEISLLGTVHDEAIGEIQENWIDDHILEKFNNHLCLMPSWANGLPLAAEGYIAKRYKKG